MGNAQGRQMSNKRGATAIIFMLLIKVAKFDV